MSETEVWVISLVAVIIAGILGYTIGRQKAPGGPGEIKSLVEDYELQLEKTRAELATYQQKVHQHHDKTAGIFKNMASSYKDLFDHLSVGYEQLGNLSDERILPERAGALLDGSEAGEIEQPDPTLTRTP
jgi:uncharacterized protein